MRSATLGVTAGVIALCAVSATLPALALGEPPYFLPYPDGTAYSVTQGPGGGTSHDRPSTRYAYDFNLPAGTPIIASAPGIVRRAKDYGGGFGYEVQVEHAGGICTQYAHMTAGSVRVSAGKSVSRGSVLGLVGSTGESYGAHLHFGKTNCGYTSKPVAFVEAKSLKTGSAYRSKNIPGTRTSVFFLRNYLSSGGTNINFGYGRNGDTPLAGNWDGVGGDTIGVFRGGTWFQRNFNSSGPSGASFGYGRVGDYPVVGNWDGVGGDTIGVFRDGAWFLRNFNSAGPTNINFGYGRAGDVPIAGNWDGVGGDTIGVFRNGTWFLRNYNSTGPTTYKFGYGRAGDLPVIGDWNNDGRDTIGVYRAGTFYLRDSNSGGSSTYRFGYGSPGDLPIGGDWDSYLSATIGLGR